MSSEPDYTINNTDVLTKYKTAGEISLKVLDILKDLLIPGATIYDLCKYGDELLLEEISKIYNSKKSKVDSKGIGFPTSISPNNIAEYLCPATADDKDANLTLKKGDVVKVQLGAQIDGYGSALAGTYVVGLKKDEKITGRAADVIAAAHYATEASLRLLNPEHKNFDITKVVSKIASAYETTPVEGMLSYNQERNVLLGDKEIIINPSDSQKSQVASLNFSVGEVYGLDILISSSKDGKAKRGDIKTTIYKLTGSNYSLKLKSSHQALAEVKKQSANFPTTTRNFADPKKGRMGLQECVSHNVMVAYDVVAEKENEIIAQFFTTAAITKNGVVKLGSANFDISQVESTHKIEDEEILALLKNPLKKSKKTKKAAN